MDLRWHDAAGNSQRFYRMELLPGLFGDWSLVREWGRPGRPGQLRVDWFDDEAAAKDARFAIQMKKAQDGFE